MEFCNDPDPPLVDIVLFGLPLKALKRVCQGKVSTPLYMVVCSPPNQCGTSQSTPLRGPASSLALFPSSNRCGTAPKSTPLWGQRPYWHTALCLPPFREQREGWHIVRCLALIRFVTTQIHR